MKRLLPILFLFGLFLPGCDDGPADKDNINITLNQEIEPLFTPTKRWVKEYTSIGSDYGLVSHFTFGSTYGRDYNLVLIEEQGDYFHFSHEYYEEDGKVYEPFNNTPCGHRYHLTFEVNPTTATTYNPNMPNSVTLISSGIITLMGKQRRAVKVWMENAATYERPAYDYWVEGVGPLFGMRPDYTITDKSSPISTGYCRILECYDGDEKIYDFSEFDESLYQPLIIFSTVDTTNH